MNNIAPSIAPTPESAVPQAAGRVCGQVTYLENLVDSLEARLESVLKPQSESQSGTALPPSHPVPLANTLHAIADRVSALTTRTESLLKRLHV